MFEPQNALTAAMAALTLISLFGSVRTFEEIDNSRLADLHSCESALDGIAAACGGAVRC